MSARPNAATTFTLNSMLWGSVGLVLTQLLTYCSARLVADALGPQQYGRFGLALVLGVYSSQFIQWGIDPLLARQLTRGDPGEASKSLSAWLRQKQIASLFALAAGVTVAMFWQHPSERAAVMIGVIDGIILAYTLPSAFDARSRTALYFAFTSGRQALYLASLLVLLLGFSARATPTTILLLHAAAIVPQIVAEWTWVRRNYGALQMRDSMANAGRLWLDAAPVALALGAWQLSMFLGAPMLEFLGRTEQMGELIVSNQIAMALFSIAIVPGRMIQVWLAAYPPGSTQFRRAVLRYTLLFALGGAALAALAAQFAAPIVVLLFGEKFRAAAPLFAWDAWRVVGASAGFVLSGALVCENRLRTYGACQVAALAAALAAAFWAVPGYGAQGAIAAVVLSQSVFAVLAAILLFAQTAPQQSNVVAAPLIVPIQGAEP